MNGALKRAVDCVLCSLCYIKPQIFTELLEKVGAKSVETKEFSKSMNISEGQLLTIAMACQSPMAVDRFLDSRLPFFLTKSILEWCSRNQKDANQSQQLFDTHGIFYLSYCCFGFYINFNRMLVD